MEQRDAVELVVLDLGDLGDLAWIRRCRQGTCGGLDGRGGGKHCDGLGGRGWRGPV